MTIFFVSADFLIVSLDLIRKSVMLTLDLLKKSPFFTLDLNFSGFTVCPIVSRNVTGRVGLLPAQQQKMPFEIYNLGNWAGNKPALPEFLAENHIASLVFQAAHWHYEYTIGALVGIFAYTREHHHEGRGLHLGGVYLGG